MQEPIHSPRERGRASRPIAALSAIVALLLALVTIVVIVLRSDRDVVAEVSVPQADAPSPATAPGVTTLSDIPLDSDSVARTSVEVPTPPTPPIARLPPSPTLFDGPGIRGRAIAPNGTSLTPGTEVTYSLENPGERYSHVVECEADGRFLVPLRSSPFARVHLTLTSVGVGRRELELKDVPAEGLDLGDIELTATAVLHFVVRDPEGRPIAGAVARIGDEIYSQSEPTDSSGRGLLDNVLPSTNEVQFMALGYKPREMSILYSATSEHAPFEVRLTPRLLLTIQVRRADGTPAPSTLVVLSTWEPDPLFPDQSAREFHRKGELGASPVKSSERSAPSTGRPTLVAKYWSNAEGRVVVDGWRPAGRLNVSLEGRVGEVIATRDVDLLWLGQRETIEFVLPDEARTLELRVVDERAEPVAGATVSTGSGRDGVLAATGPDGVARITPLFGTSVDVRVDKGTMFPAFVDGIVLDALVVRRDAVLRNGYSVRVRTVDEDLREVAVSKVEARWNGKNVGLPQRLKDEACFTLHALPGEDIELAAYRGGRVFRAVHDGRRPEAEMLLPSSGRVRVEFDSPIALDRWCIVRLVADDEPDVVLQERVRRDATQLSVEFAIVFPGHYTAELFELDPTSTPLPPIARASLVVRSNETTVVQLATETRR